ncbi:uncharacterized protein PAC_00472 [Phialocephala subalpina]|uniref:Uncharacterized protein n=1 Tax=Phialocephala subalpina TaxID=576137 RepID=A0A1L7WCY3_9HELO|nr:uncharacterized protein PAC_00472 [Phialocephala subalpina]
MYTAKFVGLVLAASACVLAIPFPSPINPDHLEIIRLRASTTVDPNAVTGTTCIDTSANIVFHDQNVAELGICDGIAGAITKCGGAPTSTTGSSGTALFNLNAVTSGATINISKGRWEGCVRAARAVCPTGTFSSTCIGGASTGNVAFTLSAQ